MMCILTEIPCDMFLNLILFSVKTNNLMHPRVGHLKCKQKQHQQPCGRCFALVFEHDSFKYYNNKSESNNHVEVRCW